MTKEPPEELYASYQTQASMTGIRECLFVSGSEAEGWRHHAQVGQEVRIGRYKLVEVKTLTLEPKFT
jgi:hypothetical protein